MHIIELRGDINLFSSVIAIKKPLVPDTKLKAEKSGKKDKNSANGEFEIIGFKK